MTGNGSCVGQLQDRVVAALIVRAGRSSRMVHPRGRGPVEAVRRALISQSLDHQPQIDQLFPVPETELVQGDRQLVFDRAV